MGIELKFCTPTFLKNLKNLSLKKVESQKSDSTGFYAISFEKKCKKYIYI